MKHDFSTANTILYCKKWEKTVSFYQNQLCLPVRFRNEWFVEFALNAGSSLSVADEKRSTIKGSRGRGVTLSLEVQDIHAVWEQIKKIGLTPTEIRSHPWNAMVFYLFDPEGYRIEIWESTAIESEV
mgnify:CR=1 FL=1